MELPLPEGPNKEMWLALIAHDNARLEAALRDGADPNCCDQQHLAPAMLAVFCDNVEAVRLLAAHGAHFPRAATGRAFDTYFDVDPAWYENWKNYNACDVVIARQDIDALRVLLNMPGAGAVLLEECWAIPNAATKVNDLGFDPCAVRLMLNAAFREEWRDAHLSEAELDLARQATFGFLGARLSENQCQEISLTRATEHVVDRGFAASEAGPGVQALSFTINYGDAAPTTDCSVDRGWSHLRLDVEGGDDAFRFGTWEISPNIVAKVSRRDSWRISPKDSEDAWADYWLTGTIFFCESAERLKEYMVRIGSDEAVGALLESFYPKRIHQGTGWDGRTGESYEINSWDDERCYDDAIMAIRAGADTSLSNFGPFAADVRAAASGRTDVLRALIKADPITRHRLAKSHFEVLSPVTASLLVMAELRPERTGDFYVGSVRGVSAPATLRALLAEGAGLCATVGQGPSHLCIASQAMDAGMVESLLAAGANPNAFGADGEVPLVSACRGGRAGIVRILLEAEADPNLCNADGVCALEAACVEGREKLMELLFESGASAQPVVDRVKSGRITLDTKIFALLNAQNARVAMSNVFDRVRRRSARLTA